MGNCTNCVVLLCRMWNLEQNDNYVLSVDGSGFEPGEVVNCISFNKVKGKTCKTSTCVVQYQNRTG